MNKETVELKPCPFCGGKAEIEVDGMFRWVECKNEHCGASGKVFSFLVDAGNANNIVANNWNIRPIEDALRDRAEKAERELADVQEISEGGEIQKSFDRVEFNRLLEKYDALKGDNNETA